MEKQALVTLEN